MGKKYDAYVKAVEANNIAKGNLQAANGGSTERGMIEAQNNARQAQLNEDDTWQQVLDDPQG